MGKKPTAEAGASFSLMVFREDGSFEEVVWRGVSGGTLCKR